ncbi:MAG: hypothetical protein GOU98_03950 [Candidatus Altiarchaeota archaeon]|nr:hypothetical protein [Candidatus Altiarchaeota archaeon]
MSVLYQLSDHQKNEVDSTWVETDKLSKGILAQFSYSNSQTKITLNSLYYNPKFGRLEDVIRSESNRKLDLSEIYGKQNILEVLGHEKYHTISHTTGKHNQDEEGKATVYGKLYKYMHNLNGKLEDRLSQALYYTKKELNDQKKMYDFFGKVDTFYQKYLLPAINIVQNTNFTDALVKKTNYTLVNNT